MAAGDDADADADADADETSCADGSSRNRSTPITKTLTGMNAQCAILAQWHSSSACANCTNSRRASSGGKNRVGNDAF